MNPSPISISPAVSCVIGTRAQLIKMAPVMRELEARHHPYHLIMTGQHSVTMKELLQEFGIRTPPHFLYEGPEISGLGAMAWWLPMMFARLRRAGKALFRRGPRGRHLVLVHGDTFTTLIGALAAKSCGGRVAHVESGLRSFSLFNPFPEELTRLACFRLTDIAYCPGPWAAGNLKGYALEVVDTGENTLLDALRHALTEVPDMPAGLPEDYCVASIHRFENIFSDKRLQLVMDMLKRVVREIPVVFVMHPSTRKQLERRGMLEALEKEQDFFILPRMTYIPFINLISNARFVITDGGSNQEELSYLGIPTLLMRAATERKEGLDKNIVLGQFDWKTLELFLGNNATHMTRPHRLSEISPSSIIVNDLEQQLYQDTPPA